MCPIPSSGRQTLEPFSDPSSGSNAVLHLFVFTFLHNSEHDGSPGTSRSNSSGLCGSAKEANCCAKKLKWPPASAPWWQHLGLSPAALDRLHKDSNISDGVCLWLHSHSYSSCSILGLCDCLHLRRVPLAAASRLWHFEHNSKLESCLNYKQPKKQWVVNTIKGNKTHLQRLMGNIGNSSITKI